mgnify:CR=1 FL=1
MEFIVILLMGTNILAMVQIDKLRKELEKHKPPF